MSRVPANLGAGGGFLALAIASYAAVGVAWGLLRPGYDATVAEDSLLAVHASANVEFAGFASFVLLTGLLSVGLALLAARRLSSRPRPGVLGWAIACAAIAVVAFAVGGDLAVVLFRHAEDAEVGQAVTVVPPINPGTALLAGPLMAGTTYWVDAMLR
ncbi:hypothetical protein [Corynebacterium uterequi]|uniref:DUF2567 domain-containing protein n=1 Tax=Corynebacterium uterequi TaxID=1072256 RepID=A0A0G3HHK8_9CORY|nr:hypothetical protein [Corynebacterium uterequi]AKK11423.1 hypothetical protein CUTER_07170 [Corynebacterium uterequi]